MMEFANKIKTGLESLLVNIILIIILSGFSNDTSAQLFSSVKSDKETGAKMDKQVKEQIGLYDEVGLTEYLNSIGQRVVKQLHNSKFDFQFKIVEQREPNAFAIPGVIKAPVADRITIGIFMKNRSAPLRTGPSATAAGTLNPTATINTNSNSSQMNNLACSRPSNKLP